MDPFTLKLVVYRNNNNNSQNDNSDSSNDNDKSTTDRNIIDDNKAIGVW